MKYLASACMVFLFCGIGIGYIIYHCDDNLATVNEQGINIINIPHKAWKNDKPTLDRIIAAYKKHYQVTGKDYHPNDGSCGCLNRINKK